MSEKPDYSYMEAPEGKVWECQACGKTSQHLCGGYINSAGRVFYGHPGWDESCAMNALLVDGDFCGP